MLRFLVSPCPVLTETGLPHLTAALRRLSAMASALDALLTLSSCVVHLVHGEFGCARTSIPHVHETQCLKRGDLEEDNTSVCMLLRGGGGGFSTHFRVGTIYAPTTWTSGMGRTQPTAEILHPGPWCVFAGLLMGSGSWAFPKKHESRPSQHTRLQRGAAADQIMRKSGPSVRGYASEATVHCGWTTPRVALCTPRARRRSTCGLMQTKQQTWSCILVMGVGGQRTSIVGVDGGTRCCNTA